MHTDFFSYVKVWRVPTQVGKVFKTHVHLSFPFHTCDVWSSATWSTLAAEAVVIHQVQPASRKRKPAVGSVSRLPLETVLLPTETTGLSSCAQMEEVGVHFSVTS